MISIRHDSVFSKFSNISNGKYVEKDNFSAFDDYEESKYILDPTIEYGEDYPSDYANYDIYSY